MPKPLPGVSPVVQTLADRAQRLGLTAYAIAKSRDMHISTVQKALDGEVSPSIATLEAIAAALGATITVQVAADVPPTGATRPPRVARATTMRSTDEAPAGTGPLTRKRKNPAATFLPGELEPVTTGAVTRKRRS
jgi:transcriptional regulator with XRE-family HTH domain